MLSPPLLFSPPMSDHSAIDRRLSTIERLLPRLSGEAAERLLIERRSLLRIRHGIPLGAALPLSVCSSDLSSSPL